MIDDLDTRLAALRDRLAPAAAAADADRDARRQAAVAAILRERSDHDLELLLIRRADRDGDVWSGHVALPGGRREPADADLVETAMRETREEVELDLEHAALLGALPRLEPMSPQLPPISVQPFVWRVDAGAAPMTSAEVAAVAWVTIDHLRDEASRIEYRMLAPDGAERVFPAIHVGGAVPLWGMTHRIVESLLDVLD